MTLNTRLLREYQSLQSAQDSGVCDDDDISRNHRVETVDDNLSSWRAFINGPTGTPFEGGVFSLSINFPESYPYEPPVVKFETYIWHPNVSSQTGTICLDILDKSWSPALTVRTVLLSVQALLAAPEPDDPLDAQVAKQYINKQDEYANQARKWTQMFAMGANNAAAKKLKTVMDMGFDKSSAEAALKRHNWEEEAALNALLDEK